MVKRKFHSFKQILVFVFIFSLLFATFGNLASTTLVADPITIAYDFREVGLDGELGTPNGFFVEGSTSTIPRVVKTQTYGIQLQTDLVYPSREIQLPVQASGTYDVYFTGFTSVGSGIGQLKIDDQIIGRYDFYAPDYMMGPELKIGKANIKAGSRKLTFTAVDKNPQSIWYYLQPSELRLVELPPELDFISIKAAESILPVNETTQLQVTGILSNEEVADLTDANIVYESSDESVVHVDSDGNVTALQKGHAKIKAWVTLNGITKEDELTIVVNSGILDRVVMTVDDSNIVVGRHSFVMAHAYTAENERIDLDAGQAQFSSSNPSVATIDSSGIIVAKSAGKTVISASVTLRGTTKSDSREIEVTEKQIVPQNIPVFVDKWTVIHPANGSMQIDGVLNESSWHTASTLSSFVTAYENLPAQLQTEVKVLYDHVNVYFGIEGELPAVSDGTESDVIELYIRTNDQRVYVVPLSTNNGKNVVSEHGSSVRLFSGFDAKTNIEDRFWTAEIAVPLQSIGISEMISGEELQVNIVRHRLHTAPVSAWFPLKTTLFTGITSGANKGFYYFYTNSESEGRLGKLYVDQIPEQSRVEPDKPLVPWYPPQVEMVYLGFTDKRIVIDVDEVDIGDSSIQLRWITPSGVIYPLGSPSIETKDERLYIEFSHPRTYEEGSYQLQFIVNSMNEAETRTALIVIDREDMIAAGDRTVNEASYTAPPTKSVALAPPSEEVQRLLDLIPSHPGIYWAGLPDHPDLQPYQLFDWDPSNPDQLTSSKSDLIFPNDLYPEDKVLQVTNRKGETVEYPYYEDAEEKRYFFTAHLWYKKREYVMKQVERLAATDPAGAVRILYKFAEMYEDFVPVMDTTWNSGPINSSSAPPNPYYGGMWEWWYYMDLRALNQLSRAYSLVKGTNAFELLSQEVGENVRAKIVNEMFVPSVEFVRSYAIRNTNMEYHVWQGLVEMGKAIDRPDYVHDAIERLGNSISSQYLFDGFWKEIALSYHAQSANGSDIVVGLLNGWTDPEGFVSQRTGERLENLNMGERLPILQHSKDLLRLLTYPDGKYVPLQDTWAWQLQSNPIDRGSLLMSAAGVARLALGSESNQSQLYMTYSPKYGHNHYDPLNLIMFSNGQELVPDLGYTYTKYRQWATSTMGHNTVVVDSKDMAINEQSQLGGSLELFAPMDNTLKIMEARQENGYSGVDEYRRQPWFISFPGGAEEDGYVIDIFRVSGGSRHEYTLQGDANHDAVFETDMHLAEYGPYLLPAGTEVVLPRESTEKGSAGDEYYGYIYLRDVQQAELSGDTYTMTLVTEEGSEKRSNLQITGLLEPGQNELYLSRSPSIRNTRLSNIDTNDRADEFTMPKFVLRREGTDLKSTFVTALEPYAAGGSARIEQVERLELDQGQEGDVAIAITYGQTKDIILSSPQRLDKPLVFGDVRLHGKIGFIRLEDGLVTKMMLIDGTQLVYEDIEVSGTGAVTGDILEVYRQAEGSSYNAFVTATEVPVDVRGQYMIVNHPDGTTHGYLINDIVIENGRSVIRIEGEPGFMVYPDGSSQMKFFPATKWTGIHTFRIANVETEMREHVSVDSIRLQGEQAEVEQTTLVKGDTTQLTAQAHYSNQTVTDVTYAADWNSSNLDVAVVENGLVTTVGSGYAYITATFGGQSAVVKLMVLGVVKMTIASLHSPMVVGEQSRLAVLAMGDKGLVDVTEWALFESSSPDVATVAVDGLVEALKVGSTVISATYGSYQPATFDLNVRAEGSSVKLSDLQEDVDLHGVYQIGKNGELTYLDAMNGDRVEAGLLRPAKWSCCCDFNRKPN